MHRSYIPVISAALFALFCCSNGRVFNVSSNGHRQVDGRPLGADGGSETIIPTGSSTTASPWVYDWDDIDGSGGDASDNLILGNSKLWTTNYSAAGLGSFALKLKNANGKGNISGNSGGYCLFDHQCHSAECESKYCWIHHPLQC
ncbi:MAG: hypothetical protein ACUVWX_07790 [Kiritimatiellia bacterium]